MKTKQHLLLTVVLGLISSTHVCVNGAAVDLEALQTRVSQLEERLGCSQSVFLMGHRTENGREQAITKEEQIFRASLCRRLSQMFGRWHLGIESTYAKDSLVVIGIKNGAVAKR